MTVDLGHLGYEHHDGFRSAGRVLAPSDEDGPIVHVCLGRVHARHRTWISFCSMTTDAIERSARKRFGPGKFGQPVRLKNGAITIVWLQERDPLNADDGSW